MKYNRTEISDGLGLSSIIDKKLKYCLITVNFITKLDISTASDNFLAFNALTDSSLDYNTISAMNRVLSDLYGSEIYTSVFQFGDLQILSVNSSWLADKYALEGEDISGEILRIFSGCLFRPNVTDGKFNDESFTINRNDLLDRIDSELNNKHTYAINRAMETAFKGEPAEIIDYGTKETAQAASPSSLYKAYKRIFETSQIEAFFVSPTENNAVEKMLRDGFSSFERRPQKYRFFNPSPLKPEPVVIKETFDVLQCKMVMIFKSDSDDLYAMIMLSMIFGEMPTSKLFANVREKLSLCYYCSSTFMASKNIMLVTCGIDRCNIEKAKDEIIRQLDEIKNGELSDDEINNAVLSFQNNLERFGDTPSSYVAWYWERICGGTLLTPEEMIELLRNISKERIINAAKSFSIDSTYIMLNKEDIDS